MARSNNTSSPRQDYKQNLWWLEHAWNKDSLEWLTMGMAPSGLVGDAVDLREEFFEEEFFTNVVPFFPEAQPPIEWLVDYYLQLGDPYRNPKSFKLVDYVEKTKFAYDENLPLGRPTQLLAYYMANYSNVPTAMPSSLWRSEIAVRHRVEMLTRLIPFTQQEWDWFVGSGCTDPQNNLYSCILANPILHSLKVVVGSDEALTGRLFKVGKTYAEKYLKSQVFNSQEDEWNQKPVTDPAAALKSIKQKFSLVKQGLNSHPVNHWLRSPFATAEHLNEFGRIYSEATEAMLELEERKRGRGETTKLRDLYLMWQLLDGIQSHPAYQGDLSVLKFRLGSLLPDGEGDLFEGRLNFGLLDKVQGYKIDKVKKYLTSSDEGYFEPSDPKVLEKVLYAYCKFTPEDALEVFDVLIGAGGAGTERRVALAVMLLPLLSIGFKKLREEYGDADSNVPLEWLLLAGTGGL